MNSYVARFYRFISSMKTGLVLLLLIGLSSALGSAWWPDTFFRTPFFQGLLIFLLLNMTLCTVNRCQRLGSSLMKRIGSRDWLRQMGILFLHLGMVLILCGGMVYTMQGQNTQIQLCAGDQVSLAQVMKVRHPFDLRLNEFKIEFYEDGSPAQYVSQVTVLENGKSVQETAIRVNHPLNHGGVKAYQTSYGYLIKTRHVDESGQDQEHRYAEGQLLKLPATDRVVKIFRYIPNFDARHGMNSKTMRADNPHIVFSVYENDKLLGVGKSRFNEAVKIDDGVMITFTGVEPYTILNLKSDPGLPLVLTGGVILMLGVCLALFTAPPRKKNRLADQAINRDI